MSAIAIVTDGTADLPRRVAADVDVVPLTVTFADGSSVRSDVADPATFLARLRAEPIPTTSQPSPDEFDAAFARAADRGAEAVVALHCSAELSGTVGASRQAATRAPIPVHVVDTRLVGGALGLAVSAARRVRDAGGDVAEVLAAVEDVRDRSTSLLVVDSLDFLRRGGRLRGAQAMVGTALRVKPMLHLQDGRVELRERARTWQRALDRVVALVAERAGRQGVDVCIVHADAEDRALQLRRMLEFAVRVGDDDLTTIGPVVATHVGPGAVGIATIVHRDSPPPGSPRG